MTIIKAFVKNHPVLSFFALVFVIAWGGILILAGGPGSIPTNEKQFERHEHTGSMLVAILMHASLTASMIILPPVITGVAYLTYNLVFTAVLWVVVGLVAIAQGGHLTRQPPLRRWVT